MTSRQFILALDRIGWTQRRLARELGCSSKHPTRWARGELVVPEAVGEWLEALEAAHRLHAAPRGKEWRVRSRAGGIA